MIQHAMNNSPSNLVGTLRKVLSVKRAVATEGCRGVNFQYVPKVRKFWRIFREKAYLS